MNPSIKTALRAGSTSCMAFVGAGGKTTALFRLARDLEPPVVVTATSHLGSWQTSLADRHIMAGSPSSLDQIEQDLQGAVLITGEPDGDRTRPVGADVLHRLQRFCGEHGLPLLIEADGSRQKSLKAWAEHEPAIPSFADQVVQVVGFSALGKPLLDEHVHRAGIYSKISGLSTGDRITPEAMVRVLVHPEGGLKNMPERARRVVILNQADTPELQSTASGMVRSLLEFYDAQVVSSLLRGQIYAVHERTAGIVLAAGESSRYGEVKQLLEWRGQPFVRAIARTALEAGLSPVLVVTGAHAGPVSSAVEGLDVSTAHNTDWKSGQASSIRAGVLALDKHIPQQDPVAGSHGRGQAGGAVFLLADQPQVTVSVLRALVARHAEGLYPIVAPMVMDRRANPVLFDRSTFGDLLALQGDVGGRAIFHRHRVEYLPWHDERLLLDVDTPEMYRRLASDETL